VATLGSSGTSRSELQAPARDGFIANLDTALRQRAFDITKAERTSVMKPPGVTDDLQRSSVPTVLLRYADHRGSLPQESSM
jgi:hypothetical protein